MGGRKVDADQGGDLVDGVGAADAVHDAFEQSAFEGVDLLGRQLFVDASSLERFVDVEPVVAAVTLTLGFTVGLGLLDPFHLLLGLLTGEQVLSDVSLGGVEIGRASCRERV